jgi:membrane fusion protein (multidrug efflux system)
VVGPEGTAQPRPVRAGPWSGTGWAIQEGLAAGDRVIVDNVMKLRPGAPVAVGAPGGAASTGGAPAGGAPSGKAEPKAGGASS